MEQDISVSLERHNLDLKPQSPLNVILTWLILVLIGLVILVLFFIGRAVFLEKSVPRSAAERTYFYYLNETKKHPKKAITWINLGQAEFDIGRYDEAVKHLKKALKIKPHTSWAHFYLALCYQAQGDAAAYVEELKAEIKNTPNNHRAYFLLGEMHYSQGRYKEAIEAFQKTLEYCSTSADAHFYLAQAYEQDGQSQLAIAEYAEVLKYIPDHQEAKEALKRLTGN